MRNPIVRSCLLAVVALLGVLTVRAGSPSAPSSVEKWGVFELTLKGPSDGNPFVDVRLSAVFSDGTHTHEVDGFYDDGGVYHVRFMPEATGRWHYETKSNRWQLTGRTGSFTVTPATKGNHGPVRVHATYHFAYADGTPYNELGTTIYNWLDTPEDWQELTLKTLAHSPFNKVRMLVFPQQEYFRKTFAPPRWPYVGTPPHDWDFTRFNVDFFRHYEMRIGQLRDLGIQADIILFNPYGKPYGFDHMGAANDELYLRYIVARFAAYRNVWWSLSNEFDFVRTKTMADWDRYFQIVQAADPYGHLRSIHNGALLYDNSKPWVTHASIQNGSAVQDPGRAEIYRDVWRKPVVFDEVKYEGDSHYRWGNLTGRQMVNRFWNGTVAGTYVGHGDYFYRDATDTWTSFGGTLQGESEPRLAFLKKILDDGPRDGLDPIDKWQDPNTAGVPGDYYLIYFGNAAPTSWAFHLYKNGVTDGMRFKADIIDTWAMTVTPVDGVFVAKCDGDYSFADASGRVIALPGKPGIALRLRRVGDDGQPAKTEQPTD